MYLYYYYNYNYNYYKHIQYYPKKYIRCYTHVVSVLV